MKLQAKDLSFKYTNDGRQILEHFDLEVDSSEVVGLIAPSGYGKTTLCKILGGYQKPDGGEVLLDGKPLRDIKGCCPVQMIWQHPEQAVNPRLRMREVIAEGDQVEERIVRQLGIEEEWMGRYPAELSGGELQRFCIARALGKSTQFLLCDEISTMLDLITQSQIWHFLMDETEKRKIGMIVVSHSQELLEKVCTRIVDLQKE